MSISTKGSRRIRVDERDYAWLIRKKPTYAQAIRQSTMRLAIQSCEVGSSSVLVVDLRISRPDNWILQHQTGVTPATVRDIIHRALGAGWDPSARASPFLLDYGLVEESIGYVQR